MSQSGADQYEWGMLKNSIILTLIQLILPEKNWVCATNSNFLKSFYSESRIECPDLILMTLDTPHGPITKFLKKNAWKMRGKWGGKLFFPFFGVWFKN